LIRPHCVKSQNAVRAAVFEDWQPSAAGTSGQIDAASGEKKLIARHFCCFFNGNAIGFAIGRITFCR
jgi:hypothetical protein